MPRWNRNRYANWRSREVLQNANWEALKRAVRNERWEEVSSLLQNSNYSSSSVEQFVAACEEYRVIYVDRDILSHCSSDHKDSLLKTAVRNTGWKEVDSLLQDSNYSSSSVKLFVTACEEYKVIHVDRDILSHCSSQQKNCLLQTALKPFTVGLARVVGNDGGRWDAVKILLQDCDYRDSSVDQFVTACVEHSMIYVDCEILYHCNSQQKERLLKTAVKLCRGLQYAQSEKKWKDVKILLKDFKYSGSIVEMFIAACEQNEVIYVDGEILSHCSSEQKDRLLKTAVKLCGGLGLGNMGNMGNMWNKWNNVKILLQDCNDSSSSVEMFIEACEQYEKVPVDREILSHCSSEQKDRLLKTAVKRSLQRHLWGQWWEVDSLLQDSSYSSSSVDQLITACEQYEVIYPKQDLLPHCTTQQLDRLLTLATTKREWIWCHKVWEAGCSLEKRVWAIAQACNTTDISRSNRFILAYVDNDLLSQCNTEQLDSLLTAGTAKGEVELVDKVLKVGGSHEKRLWVIEKACHSVNGTIFDEYILPHINHDFLSQCSTQQLDRLLETATSQNRWQCVSKVLEAGGSLEKRVWAIEQACLSGHDQTFMFNTHVSNGILSQCSTQQQDSLLKAAVTGRRWQIVDILLKAGCSHERRAWAVEQACDPGGPLMTHYRSTILHSTFAVSGFRSLWDTSFDNYILPHVNHDLLSHCTTKQLDRLLTTMTTVRQWDIIDKVLRAGGSHGKRVWVFKEACLTADLLEFRRYISPHCNDHMYKHLRRILIPENKKHTILFYAMLNEHCPRTMVAECIRLGFSTHQGRHISMTNADIVKTVTQGLLRNWNRKSVPFDNITPLLLAVLRGMPVVAHMLYESGSSYSELLHLYTLLLELSDPHTEDGRNFLTQYKAFMNTLISFLPYLKEMASTPHSLVSTCRLAISHCLTVGGGRDRAVQKLPLPEGLKDYLLFSDLTDPDYQPRMYRTMSAAVLQQE